jgi:quinolinate synthase
MNPNTLDEKQLKDEIRRLLKKKNAIMLAHNYQRDEIQEIADVSGDSLGLAQAATKTEAEIIVFCGVHFMAESAAILNPEKKVLLPNLEAGCPLADMITVEKLVERKKEEGDVSVVCYINSSADVKAESDICCTSANAANVINFLPGKGKILMVPDKNLANYTAKFTSREVIPWDGFCPTHHRFIRKEDVLSCKEEHPMAKFMAHPECTPEILDLADHVCSTSGMYKYAKESESLEFIVGTESGILYRLRKENPEKNFYLPSQDVICPNMKVTTLEDVFDALTLEQYAITVPEDIRVRAKKCLDRMLEVPRVS